MQALLKRVYHAANPCLAASEHEKHTTGPWLLEKIAQIFVSLKARVQKPKIHLIYLNASCYKLAVQYKDYTRTITEAHVQSVPATASPPRVHAAVHTQFRFLAH